MWLPQRNMAVRYRGQVWLVEDITGSGTASVCALRNVDDPTITRARIGYYEIEPDGKPRPAGRWAASDYLLHWEGEEFLLRITPETFDGQLFRLVKHAEDYAARRGVQLVGTLEYMMKYRQVLREPQTYPEQFDALTSWRKAMEDQHERQGVPAFPWLRKAVARAVAPVANPVGVRGLGA